MTAMGTTIRDAAHLHVVPDGTIISWLRLPGDRTSEAVAFVRREIEHDDITGNAKTVVWVSPGGWDPHTIEEAGVTFPCQVVRWGDVSAEMLCGSEIPTLVQTLESGGTWAREKALACAVDLFRGESVSWILPRNGEGPYLDALFDVAQQFEVWLDRDADAEALNEALANHQSPFDPAPGDWPADAVTQRRLDHAAALRKAVDTIRECREEYGGAIASDAALSRMTQLADSLTRSDVQG